MTLRGQQLAQAISQAHGPELPPMPSLADQIKHTLIAQGQALREQLKPMRPLVRTPVEFLETWVPDEQDRLLAAVDLECLIRRAVQTALREQAERVTEALQ